MTQTQLFDWGNLSVPARTYNNTYLINQIYSPKYILNRLLNSTVTAAGGSQVTLVTNQYDNGPADVSGMQEHDPAYTQGYTIRGNLATHFARDGKQLQLRHWRKHHIQECERVCRLGKHFFQYEFRDAGDDHDEWVADDHNEL